VDSDHQEDSRANEAGTCGECSAENAGGEGGGEEGRARRAEHSDDSIEQAIIAPILDQIFGNGVALPDITNSTSVSFTSYDSTCHHIFFLAHSSALRAQSQPHNVDDLFLAPATM
jgi:hypothetical protein